MLPTLFSAFDELEEVGEDFAGSTLTVAEPVGTVWSDSSLIGGGRRLCFTRLRAPQSESLGSFLLSEPG